MSSLTEVESSSTVDLTLSINPLKELKKKKIENLSKACHVGIHWKALIEYLLKSTHLPGFH